MQIRTRLALHLAAQLALLAAVVLALLHLAGTYRDMERAQWRRFETHRLVAELHDSSDKLTLMARLFVLRGEQRFADHYDEIDAIRAGRLARPQDYDGGYWSRRLSEPGAAAVLREPQALPLLERMQAAGFHADELALLAQAKHQSELLMRRERQAMALARNSAAQRTAALEMVSGDEYLQGKAAIVRPMQQMLAGVERRLQRERTAATGSVQQAAWMAGGALLLLTLQSLWSAHRFDRSVRQPLAALRDWAQSVSSGRHGSRTQLPGDDEFGQLSAVIDEMAAAVERNLAELREEVQRRTRAEEVVQHLANHDALTGLPSLRLLHDRLERALARAQREGKGVALLFVDLNGFKPVNDRYGHESGDMVLKVVGQRLVGGVREADTVGRIGGDEFLVLLPDVGTREAAEQVRIKLDALVRQPIYLPVHKVVVQVSAAMGLALYPEQAQDAATLLRLADQDMYAQKAAQKAAALPEPPPVALP
jgi:diguanylate cyclase (GGDEF)-like protein